MMKNKTLLSILFFFLFSNLLIAQIDNNVITNYDLFANRADSLMLIDSFELVLSEIQSFTKENTALNKSKKAELDFLSGKANANLARQLNSARQFQEAAQQYKVAMVFFEKITPIGEVELAMVYKNLGTAYRNLFNLNEAKKYLKKALDIFLKNPEANDANILSTYYNLGIVFNYEGDFGRSYDYTQKAFIVANKLYTSDHVTIGTILELQSHNDVELNRKEEAIRKIELAQKIRLKNKDKNPYQLYRSYTVAGALYSDLERYPEALDNYQKGLKTFQDMGENDPLDLAIVYGLIGVAHSNLGDFKKANEFMAQAYQLSSEAIGEQHPEPAGHLTEWAFINLLEHKYELAEQRFEKAALDFGYNPNSDLPYENISDDAYFLDVLIGKGTAIKERAEIDNNKDTFLKAAAVFEQAADVLSILKTKFNDPLSKLSNINLYYELFEKLIDTRLQIYEITNDIQFLKQAVDASEESKAYLLLENLRSIDARKFSGIPDSLLAKETQLKTKYNNLQLDHFDANQAEKIDQQLLNDLQEEMFSVKQELNNLIDYFKNNHDNYFKLKYQKQKLDFRQIQNSLANDESLIEYFVGDSSVFVFNINKEKIDYQKIKIDFPLNQWIKEMQKGITTYHQNEADQSLETYTKWKAQYQERAFQLYEKLLLPLKGLRTKLTIIPDANLWYLPFEALLTQQYDGEFRDAPYLLYNYSVSYQYAINLYLDGKQNLKTKNNVLAVAPIFEPIEKTTRAIPFLNLRYNQLEVQQIAQLVNADVLKKEAALKSSFLAKAKNYGILHFATHAQLNSDNNEFSFLAFTPFGKDTSDWKLYVNELYNMELAANLVVLSACEAGAGDWQRGEGLTSLGRGFIYAGAKNIVSTLWKVNDRSTANMMNTFYQNLKNGEDIDLSLRHSKLSYLLAQKEDRMASPFYWAAFTTLGNTGSVDFQQGNQQYVFIFAGMLLIFFVWLFLRMKKN